MTRRVVGVEVRTCEGSVGELVDALGGATDVVLVDAVRGSGPPGTVTWCPDGALPPQVRPTGTHDMGLAEALGLIVALDQAPARLTVVGIEGADFTLGRQALTPAVAEAVARVTAELADANADADA